MSTIIDGSAGITFPNSTVQASAGSVIQVVQSTLTSTVSSATSTYANTGLAATITPKFATSKIMIMVNLACCGKYSTSTELALRITKNGSVLFVWDDDFGYNNTTAQITAQAALNYLDSPATTFATTYALQFASYANTTGVVINNSNGGNAMSTFTLMEIAA